MVEDRPPSVSLSAETDLFEAHTDACFQWLQRRYADRFSSVEWRATKARSGAWSPSLALENDLDACKVLRWSRFAFPSEPHTPLRTNYNHTVENPSFVRLSAACRPRPANASDAVRPEAVAIVLRERAESTDVAARAAEPSRHLFHDAVRQRREGVSSEAPRRPFWGGYLAPTGAPGSLRLLLFPQSSHRSWGIGAGAGLTDEEAVRHHRRVTPQAVPYYLRGTIRGTPPARSATDPLLQETAEPHPWRSMARRAQMSLSYGHRDLLAGSSLGQALTAVYVDAFLHEAHTERRYVAERDRVERCALRSSGLRVETQGADPRHLGAVEARLHTVPAARRPVAGTPEGGMGESEPSIVSLALQRSYESSRQRWALPPAWWRWLDADGSIRSATYACKARLGPGVEWRLASREAGTFFGRVSTESWLELPLPRRFQLRLRQQADAVVVLAAPRLADVDVAAGAPPRETSRPHDYFWATQGPVWNAKLVRGFDNDYSAMHQARRWYAVFSAELSRRREKRTERSVGQSSRWDRAGVLLFANACLVDHLLEYPRASVGLSLTSEVPRLSVDAFNRLVPSVFECHLSWFVAFREGRLKSGVGPETRDATAASMRVSPVETFRHMRCGLTWNL